MIARSPRANARLTKENIMRFDHATLLQNINVFLADEPIVKSGSEAILPRTTAVVIEPPSKPDVHIVKIARTFVARWNARIALSALRRAGITPNFTRPADISYSISNPVSYADFSIERWLRKTDFSEELAMLDRFEAECHAHNQAEAERLAAHPISIRALNQNRRQAEIETTNPTAEVDAWIIANMGYTAESLAALGKATRRDRRREARQRMARG